jgi:hypothetical protein
MATTHRFREPWPLLTTPPMKDWPGDPPRIRGRSCRASSTTCTVGVWVRCVGYNYFGRHPEKVLAFFDSHMKHSGARKEGVAEESVAA